MADERVCIGVITAPHGVRGMVRIKPFTATAEAVAAYGPVMLEDGRRLNIEIKSITKGLVLARLDQVNDRETAETLKGCALFVAKDTLPLAEADEIYHHDLIGCVVEDEAVGAVGTVTGVFDFGGGAMLEVARDGGQSVLIPFGGDIPMTVQDGSVRLRIDPVRLEG